MATNNFIRLLVIFFLVFSYACRKLEKEMMVKTGVVDNISFTSAEVSGEIIDAGNGISQYGHCYGLSSDLNIQNSLKTTFGAANKPGSFTSTLNDLQHGMKYYVKSFISNENSVIYGETVSFNTASVSQPNVITSPVKDVTQRSAVVGGNTSTDPAPPVIDRGVCWNTSGGPTIDDNRVSTGQGGSGIFEITLHDLTANTNYYFRAYASTIIDTYYGEVIPFKTEPVVLPVVETLQITSITDKSGLSGGNIIFDGGGDIIEKGVCWSSTGTPTILDPRTTNGAGIPYFFESQLSGLTSNFVYHVRAYATNSAGTAYGNQIDFITDFICGNQLIDQRDGRTYPTKQYGEQCWMTANLNTGIKIDGSSDQKNNGTIEKYCYDNNEVNCNVYGGLYQWDEMMQYTTVESSKGICPAGWHIPSDQEWKIFEIWLGMSPAAADGLLWRGTDEGGKLKAAGTSYWVSPNTGATNSTLFTALPTGDRTSTGTFEGLGSMTDYWTSSLIIDTHVYYRMLDATHSQIYRVDGVKQFATPLRCIKDQK